LWIVRSLVLFVIVLGSTIATGQEPKHTLPTVSVASVPFYPAPARVARIQGTVKLRVSTNGERVSDVTVEGGPSMLVPAAEQNVRTWRFREHESTTFEVTFQYKMLPGDQCDADNGEVTLRLPTEVEVSAKGIETCDPVSNVAKKQ
jgi:hypothetical protein